MLKTRKKRTWTLNALKFQSSSNVDPNSIQLHINSGKGQKKSSKRLAEHDAPNDTGQIDFSKIIMDSSAEDESGTLITDTPTEY